MKPIQIELTLFPLKEVEVDGIQMGVLSDGSPYLTARGLARMCGVDNSVLIRFANNWDEEQLKPRGIKIKELLAAQGHKSGNLYRRTKGPSGETHAYTDAVCMALLEYYAFEAQQGESQTAVRNYRLLARLSFRTFIYGKVGYDPTKRVPDSWKTFHERILLNDSIPVNYFSVFREIADLVIHMIHAGIPIDSHCVPDISVGQHWGKFWLKEKMEEKYGVRKKYPHVYPDWFPQSAVNPIDAWIYPINALGVFRVWVYENYVPKSFPAYISAKVAQGLMAPEKVVELIESVKKQPRALR